MGCSVSRSHTLLTKSTRDQGVSSNSSSSQSPFQYSYSDSSSTPVSRTLSFSTPLVHHPALRRGDTNHLVSLTSTTYGSLVIDKSPPNPSFIPQDSTTRSFSLPVMIKSRVVQTDAAADPSTPDSVINTWELMEGLDDDNDDGVNDAELGFHIVHAPIESPNKLNCDTVKSYEIMERSNELKPLWKCLSEESMLVKMEPIVVSSSYRKAALSSPLLGSKEAEDTKCKAIQSTESKNVSSLLKNNLFYLPNAEDRIVLYYTSLRGIRKTCEDCCEVRMIFGGFRVCVDERDISMDSSYRKELQNVFGGKPTSLPQVFIRGNHIGGADEIKQLHEAGDLGNILEGFPVKDPAFVCDNCGDARFLLCPNCNGSRKVFQEDRGRLRRCPDCNENGLVRCPCCCS